MRLITLDDMINQTANRILDLFDIELCRKTCFSAGVRLKGKGATTSVSRLWSGSRDFAQLIIQVTKAELQIV